MEIINSTQGVKSIQSTLSTATFVTDDNEFIVQVTDSSLESSASSIIAFVRKPQHETLHPTNLPAHLPSTIRIFDIQANDQNLYDNQSTRIWLDRLFKHYGFDSLSEYGSSDDDEECWLRECFNQVRMSPLEDSPAYPARKIFRIPLKQSMGQGKHFSFSEVSVRFLIPDSQRMIGKGQGSLKETQL